MSFAKRAVIVLLLAFILTGCAKEIDSVISYKAIGTASTLDLAYRDASGELLVVEDYPRPWALKLTGYRNRQTLELRVRPATEEGSAVCVIAIDGRAVAIDEVIGLPEEAVCIYRLP